MQDHAPFLRTDEFQQVIYTSAGTIDVIATDQNAARHRARLLSHGFARLRGAARRFLARLARASSVRLDGTPDADLVQSRF
jgi:hypothetical protein